MLVGIDMKCAGLARADHVAGNGLFEVGKSSQDGTGISSLPTLEILGSEEKWKGKLFHSAKMC
jgi:hypothetical protein